MDHVVLDKLIKQNNVSYFSLLEAGVDDDDAYCYLFIHDLIAASELVRYFRLSKMTVYRRYFRKQCREKYSRCVISPFAVFRTIDEYMVFLKWRDKDRGIYNIKDIVVAGKLGYTVRHVRRLKRNGMLVAGTKPGTVLRESVNFFKGWKDNVLEKYQIDTF